MDTVERMKELQGNKEANKALEKPGIIDGKNKKALEKPGKISGKKKALEKPGMGQGFGHTRKPDVYTIDESLIKAGPYFNTKAGRKLVRDEAERDMGMSATGTPERRRESGFDLEGDSRIRQATMRYRMDTHMNISLSFDPGNMM